MNWNTFSENNYLVSAPPETYLLVIGTIQTDFTDQQMK